MAKLSVCEYQNVALLNGSLPLVVPIATEDSNVVDQAPITISGTAAQSAAFAATTRFIRLQTDSICSIAFGTNPTASTNNKRFSAESTEYFEVIPGQKLSVIANT